MSRRKPKTPLDLTTRDGVKIWKDADGWMWLRMGVNEICLTPTEVRQMAGLMDTSTPEGAQP